VGRGEGELAAKQTNGYNESLMPDLGSFAAGLCALLAAVFVGLAVFSIFRYANGLFSTRKSLTLSSFYLELATISFMMCGIAKEPSQTPIWLLGMIGLSLFVGLYMLAGLLSIELLKRIALYYRKGK
jgi:tellurite resistance protein TehA-like permease